MPASMTKNKSGTGLFRTGLMRRSAAIAAIVTASLGLSACTNAFTSVRTQGYEISDSSLAQVRPGQSKELVVVVMGSPQTQGTFGDESAFYYVETKIEQTQFGLNTVQERTVLAVYFDADDKVKDKAIYTLQDGRVFAVESRRTPSFGQDRTFIEQILSSF